MHSYFHLTHRYEVFNITYVLCEGSDKWFGLGFICDLFSFEYVIVFLSCLLFCHVHDRKHVYGRKLSLLSRLVYKG